MTSIERVPGRSGLLEKLLASVRAEFRNEMHLVRVGASYRF